MTRIAANSPVASVSDWRIGPGRRISLMRPTLMGILNATPDSFSDGGAYATVQDAVAGAMKMIEAGARIIDVGGESTRPGAAAVADAEQIRRTVPVIEAIRRQATTDRVAISIDTTRSAVARAALEAGADIINDVSAGADDAGMLALAAARHCGLILMHRLRSPQRDSFSTQYAPGSDPDYSGDVYGSVHIFLHARIEAAMKAGVQRNAIVIDPGLGFGKTVAQNLELAARLGELQRDLQLPALSAASRKSFLTPPTADQSVRPPIERDDESVALTLSHWQMGVRLFRVHNVLAHAKALAAAAATHAEQTRSGDG